MTKHPVLDSVTKLDPPASSPEPQASGAERLTTSPFHIDHEAEARAKIIAQLREDAHEMVASVARLRILGDQALADEEGDYARALRVAAQHLASADSVP